MKFRIFLLTGTKSVYVADSTEETPEDSKLIGEFEHEGPTRNFPVFAAVRDALQRKQIFDAAYYNIFTKDSLPKKESVPTTNTNSDIDPAEDEDPESNPEPEPPLEPETTVLGNQVDTVITDDVSEGTTVDQYLAKQTAE